MGLLARTHLPDGVVVLALDHPPANALSDSLTVELTDALDELAADPRGPAVVLTGTGERFFCAGGDIKELHGSPMEAALKRMRLFHRLLISLERFPRPLVCAVNGYAVGGGLELTLFADHVVAVPNARFGFPEINHGLLPAVKGMRQSARRLGHRASRRLLYTGDIVDCQEAVGLGIVDRVVDTTELLDLAAGLARDAGAKPPVLLAAIKRAIHRTEGWTDDDLEEATIEDMRSYFEDADAHAARELWTT